MKESMEREVDSDIKALKSKIMNMIDNIGKEVKWSMNKSYQRLTAIIEKKEHQN